MKYCTNCGKEIKEGTKFCPYCGKEIPREKAKKEKAPKKKNKGLLIFGLIVAAAVVLCCLLAIKTIGKKTDSIAEDNNSKEETEVTETKDTAKKSKHKSIFDKSTPVENFTFEEYKREGYVITEYHGSDKNLVIPEEYEELPVVGIKKKAFSGADIESVVIPVANCQGFVVPLLAFASCRITRFSLSFTV